MDAEDIIHTIQEAERRKQVLKLTGRRSAQAIKPHWQISLVNDPKVYRELLDADAGHEETGFFKFKVSSLEQGKKICKDIFDFHEIREAELMFTTDLDPAKKIYLVVNVLYNRAVEQKAL